MTLNAVRELPWEKQLEYFAKDASLYKQEMDRVNAVLAKNPENMQAVTWRNQLNAAWGGEDLNNVISGNFDPSKYKTPTMESSVKTRDYLATAGGALGLNLDVDWDNSNVIVGGHTVSPDYVSQNGNSYINKKTADSIVQQIAEDNGVKNRWDIYQKYSDKYGTKIDDLIKELTNRKSFEYDPDTDPVFAAYKEQYGKSGNKAMEDAMGTAGALNSGMATSNAVTAGAMAKREWDDALMGRLGELANNAYERYAADYDMKGKTLQNLINLSNSAFDREYGVNNDIISGINKANEVKNATKQEIDAINRDEARYAAEAALKNLESDRNWAATQTSLNQAQREQEYKEEQDKIKNLITFVDMFGEVYSDQVAEVIGLPKGTPTYEVKKALQDQANKLEVMNLQKETDKELLEKKASLEANTRASSSASRSSSSSSSSSSGSVKTTASNSDNGFRIPDRDLSQDEIKAIMNRPRSTSLSASMYKQYIDNAYVMLNGYKNVYIMSKEPRDLAYLKRRSDTLTYLVESNMSSEQFWDAVKLLELDEGDLCAYKGGYSSRMIRVMDSQ